MSIVTFDGRVLAADSRKTITHIEKDGTKKYLRTVDEQVKIVLLDGSKKFRGERIEAIGRCGNLKLSSALIKDIEAGVMDLELFWSSSTKLQEFKVPASLLIVTDKNAYHFRASPKTGIEVIVLERKPFAMGSGTEVAMYLMDTLKLPACEAAMAVTLKFKSCGGAIHVLKRDKWTGRLVLADSKCSTIDADERRVMVAEAILRSVSRMKARAEERLAKNGSLSPPATGSIASAKALLESVLGVAKKKTARPKVVKATKKAVTKTVKKVAKKKAKAA